MRMIKDNKLNKRIPVKENVSSYSWFPNNNIIITVTEKYDNTKKKIININNGLHRDTK